MDKAIIVKIDINWQGKLGLLVTILIVVPKIIELKNNKCAFEKIKMISLRESALDMLIANKIISTEYKKKYGENVSLINVEKQCPNSFIF